MGVSEEQIAKAQARPVDAVEAFGVWDENWQTWLIFSHYLADQWVYLPDARFGVRRHGGPPPTQIEAVLRMLRVPRAQVPTVFEDLKDMVWAVIAQDQLRQHAG